MWTVRKDINTKQNVRDAVVDTIQELMKTDETIVALEADLGGASKFAAIGKSNPDRYINAGIAEANMVGMAAGLSMRGYTPFLHTFAPFATRRVGDQVYLSGVYSKNRLNIYGSDPGVCVAANGGTHTSFEDMAFMRALPNVWVLDPADHTQTVWCVKEMAKRGVGVNYLRGHRKDIYDLYEAGSTFEIGKGNIIKEGKDVLLVSCGQVLHNAYEAALELEKEGISVEVIDMFCIKPFDANLIAKEAVGKKAVVTFENHSVIGGLGSAVAEALSDNGIGVKLRRVGVNDQTGQVGTLDYLMKEFGLTKENLIKNIKEVL